MIREQHKIEEIRLRNWIVGGIVDKWRKIKKFWEAAGVMMEPAKFGEATPKYQQENK